MYRIQVGTAPLEGVLSGVVPANQTEERTPPPSQNQYMQENNLGELLFAQIHAGPVFALARIQENIFEELLSAYLPNSWGNSFRCEDMPRLYSHPREYRKNSWRIIYVLVSCQGGKLRELSEKESRISSRTPFLRGSVQYLQGKGGCGTSSGLFPRKFANLQSGLLEPLLIFKQYPESGDRPKRVIELSKKFY